jgi:uncharacterized integral membrane protein
MAKRNLAERKEDQPMSETLNGAEPARLILPPGTTAAEIATMDLEGLNETVTDRRNQQAVRDAVDPAPTNEQIAEAIVDDLSSAPPDVGDGETQPAKSRKASPLGLWIIWLVVHELAAGILAVLLLIVASLLKTEPSEMSGGLAFVLGWPLILGTLQWLVLKRWIPRYRHWLIPTTAGVFVYSLVEYLTWNAAWSSLPALWPGIITGALLGGSLGIAQWLTLRRRFSRAGWWIVATTAGWALAGLGDYASDCLTILTASAPAALTGIALVWLVPQAIGEGAETVSRPMQTCPHCGEQVPSRAAVCRYCQGWLVDRQQAAVAGEKQPARGIVHSMRHGVPRSVWWAAALGALAALALPTVSLVARATACGPLHSSVIMFAVLALAACAPAGALPAVLAWIMGRRRDGGTAKSGDFSVPRAVAGGVLGVINGIAVSATCAFMTFFPECL